MPGPQVKDWDLYHKLRAQGKSKKQAAIIANSTSKRFRPGETYRPTEERVKADLRPKKKKKNRYSRKQFLKTVVDDFNDQQNRRKKKKRPSEYAAVAGLYLAGHTADKPPSVSKHGIRHNEKSHGNWADGGSVGMGMPKIGFSATGFSTGSRNKRKIRVPKKLIYPDMHPATEEERKKYKVPPAWTDVHISDNPDAPLQARGRDAAGRIQSRYSAAHTEAQAAKKFARIQEMANHLSEVDARIDKDVEESDEAAALMLIRRLGMRPGSNRDTRAAKKAYGATTLEHRHVKFNESGSATLKFTGKKGVPITITTDDPDIVNMLRDRTKKRPGQRLFTSTDTSTRDYFYSVMGSEEFNLKDLRTVKANVIALDAIGKTKAPKTKTEFNKKRKEIATKVSKVLGNTPTIALASYINPTVFDKWAIQNG